LNIAFGKLLLRPVLGPETFTAFAQAAKYAHNFTAFPFMVGVLLIAGLWFKDNIPRKIDIDWFMQGGGFIKSKKTHPPAGRFNGGEKGVYWIVLGAGLLISYAVFCLKKKKRSSNVATIASTQLAVAGARGPVALFRHTPPL